MKNTVDILDASKIGSLCPGLPRPEVYDTADSTNNTAKRRAEEGCPQFLCIAADSQTNGRGRLGRSFASPRGSGLYMSVVLRPSVPAEHITLITPASAVILCRAAEEIFGISPSIKWVNDLYLGGRKICGILTEAAFSPDGHAEYAVVGAGINMYRPEGGFPPEIADKAGYMLEAAQPDARSRMCAAFIRGLSDVCAGLSDADKGKSIADEYRRRCFVIGKRVTFIKNGKSVSATAVDTDDCCRLIVKHDSGELEALSTGEVSVRIENTGSI